MIDPRLQHIATFFGVGEIKSAERAGGNANANYFVETDRGSYLFKIILEQYGKEEKLQEARFVAHLAQYHFPVVANLAAPSGESVYEAEGYLAIIQNRLLARPPVPSLAVNAAIGAALARLHTLPVVGLPDKRHWLREDYLPKAFEIAKPYFESHPKLVELKTLYEQLPFRALYAGERVIVHGDLYADNVLFAGDELAAFIDWEETGLGPALLDFAMTVVGCTDALESENSEAELFSALYEAYVRVKPFSQEEEDLLEDAVQYVALTTAVWRFLHTNHYHPNEAKKDRYLLFWERRFDRWKRPVRVM